MYKVKWTVLQEEIFRFLCVNAGKSFNLRGVAKALGVSPTAVSNALPELEKEKIVSVNRSESMNLLAIELNRDNEMALVLKRVENLKMLYQSGLVGFLRDEFPGTTIVLFGSYSNGGDIYSSDIDIAIVETKGKNVDLEKFEKILKKEIIINFYPSFMEIHKHLRNNIFNGIVLVGSIDL